MPRQLPKHTSSAQSTHAHSNSRPETGNVQAIKRFKWIHTLILTDIADAEPPLIGAMVSWPAQKKLVAGGGDVEGCGEVTTQCGQCLTVNCGSFKWNKRERQFSGGLLYQIIPVKKLVKAAWCLGGTQFELFEITFGKYLENWQSADNNSLGHKWWLLCERHIHSY